MSAPTAELIEAAKTAAGGWTRAQLAEWGVAWPPAKGWRRLLEQVEPSVAPTVRPTPESATARAAA